MLFHKQTNKTLFRSSNSLYHANKYQIFFKNKTGNLKNTGPVKNKSAKYKREREREKL